MSEFLLKHSLLITQQIIYGDIPATTGIWECPETLSTTSFHNTAYPFYPVPGAPLPAYITNPIHGSMVSMAPVDVIHWSGLTGSENISSSILTPWSPCIDLYMRF